ncbi:MAG: hypothetical protein OHK0017_07920 [Patescibacteria group bacterium]
MSIHNHATSSTPNTNTRLFSIVGTVSIAGSATVTGSGTSFLNELKVGDRITIGSETRRITAISNNTSLTVNEAFAATATGQVASYIPSEFDGGARVVSIKASNINTGSVFIGMSQNTAKDGADVTSTTRVWRLAPGEVMPPFTCADPSILYDQSDVATQRYNIIVN